MATKAPRTLILLALLGFNPGVWAGSATWNPNPVDDNWENPANWLPATIPYGETDVATFGASAISNVVLGATAAGDADNLVATIVFEEEANPYTITAVPAAGVIFPTILDFYGDGIVNNSGVTQNFFAPPSGTMKGSGRFYFNRSASAGENVVITNGGSDSAEPDGNYGAFTSFEDTSTAGRATFINQGGTAAGGIYGGFTNLLDNSNSQSATFINEAGTVADAPAGHTLVQTGGRIGKSTFIGNAASVSGAEGGWVELDAGTSAGASFSARGAAVADAQGGQVYTYGGGGYASFTAGGGTSLNAQGGLIDLWYVPASSQTVVTANGGTNGGLGGVILIEDSADIPLPQFQVFGNGTLDLSNVTDESMPIGSLAGDGLVLLAGHDLNVGNNDLDTTFSGVIQGDGSLSKVGLGTLTLSGPNTYTGGTTVSGGVLEVNRSRGSGTGTGPVQVNGGTLGGNGLIAGAVTIGTGAGGGATLAPGISAGSKLVTLRTESGLTLKSDATYGFRVSAAKKAADQMAARGVTIESGAQFEFEQMGNKKLSKGTVFTVINNMAGTPISGVFANLPDHATVEAGRNTYQANYEGGTGNDLTLTVQ